MSSASSNVPATSWAQVLRFAGEAGAAATSRVVGEAVPFCLAELAADPGVAVHIAITPSLAGGFAAALLFPRDTVLARHFATRRSIVATYLHESARPSLVGFAAWLFARPGLRPLIRLVGNRTALSFGTVRQKFNPFGPRGWEISGATTDAAAQDLQIALHGVARMLVPDFPYLWVQLIQQEERPRCSFMYPRDTVVVSLVDARAHGVAAGVKAPAELCAPGIWVSFSVPVTLNELPVDRRVDMQAVLENAGFTTPVAPRSSSPGTVPS